VEQALGRIAGEWYGVVKRAQLLRAGVSDDEIRQRLRTGALTASIRASIGWSIARRASRACYLAAVWACGERALLSGRAAAYLLGLLKGAPPAPEVTAPVIRRVHGGITHRSRRMDAADAMVWRRIPVTTGARTLVDIAADTPEDELTRACHEAGVRYATTPRQVDAVLARRPTAPGAAKLRRVMRGDAPAGFEPAERHCF